MGSITNFIKEYYRTAQRTRWNQSQIESYQHKQLRTIVQRAWDKSPFYQQLYSDHGINRTDLATIELSALPLVTKELLMDNFDDVVTDRSIKKYELEEWLGSHRRPKQLYKGKYTVLHTSGSSGTVGLFIYNRRAWNTLRASVINRVSTVRLNPFNKTRLAYYAATHGRFAGITLTNDAPPFFYTVLPTSILTPIDTVCAQLNEFEPDQLSGYSSTVTHLAEKQIANVLHINPQRIIVSGDAYTPAMHKIIETAWPAAHITNLYAASESIGIAVQHSPHSHLCVHDDLHVIEVLDEHHQPVSAGESGQVVMTNLYNKTFPLIRYQMNDIATRGANQSGCPFSVLQKIHGRTYDALPITLDTGNTDTIHPIVLSEFFVPHLQKIQFIGRSKDEIEIHYVAKESMTDEIRDAFNTLLVKKGAIQATTVDVKRKKVLHNNTNTGKLALVELHYDNN